MATDPHQRLLTVREFLQIDFGPDIKAELDEGVVRMVDGSTRGHARVQMNLCAFFGTALRGTGFRPYGSDMAVAIADRSVRFPDLTIDGSASVMPDDRLLDAPRIVIEVMSPSTRRIDEGVKLAEYRALASVDTILLVDPEAERCRVVERMGENAWRDVMHMRATDIELPALGLTIPHDEIFARD